MALRVHPGASSRYGAVAAARERGEPAGSVALQGAAGPEVPGHPLQDSEQRHGPPPAPGVTDWGRTVLGNENTRFYIVHMAFGGRV